MSDRTVSVIIPALNEESNIARCVESARAALADEIIVSDGGSDDETIRMAESSGATLVTSSEPGRGKQLRCGAERATCQWLVFLHADNELGEDCLNQIRALRDARWGAFEQKISGPSVLYRLLERGNASRVRWRKMPFGDQGVFVRRTVYESMGGFDDVPLMEDVEFALRIRKRHAPVLLPGPVIVSARRWQRRGVIRQTARNWMIQIAHATGASPERLASWYR